MVESGLIQKAHPAEVTVGFGTVKSRYVPLMVPRSGDVSAVLAVFLLESAPNGPGAGPTQFMMVLGDGVARVDLTSAPYPGGIEAVLNNDAGQQDALVEKLERFHETKHSSNMDNAVGGCQNLVIGYRLFARGTDGRWVEYLHGPFTFQCNETSDDVDKDALKPSSPSTASPSSSSSSPDGGHKFDHGDSGGPGGFDGSFLAADGEALAVDPEAVAKMTSDVAVINVHDTQHPQYAPLTVQQQNDVDLLVARLDPIPEEKHQFRLDIGVGAASFALKVSTSDVVWKMSEKHLADLVERIAHDASGCDDCDDDCDDCCDEMTTTYTLYGRELGCPWVEYAHGPLLFACEGTPAKPSRKNVIKSPTVDTQTDGPFMTKSGFNPAFMATQGEEGT